MIKQRRDAQRQFSDAGRQDLAEVEAAEILVLQDFMPKPLDDHEIDALIERSIVDSGAQGPGHGQGDEPAATAGPGSRRHGTGQPAPEGAPLLLKHRAGLIGPAIIAMLPLCAHAPSFSRTPWPA